jgi:hypothetical protein
MSEVAPTPSTFPDVPARRRWSCEIANDRAYASVLARRYFYDRSVTPDVVIETLAGTTDPLIAELVALIATEPYRNGMAGARYDQYVKHYWPAVAAVLQQLDRGAAGVLPARGRFSVAKLLGYSGLVSVVAMSAFDHILALINHLQALRC